MGRLYGVLPWPDLIVTFAESNNCFMKTHGIGVMKVVSDGLRKRMPTLSELRYYGKKASTGGNGLASPLPSHAEAYNHIK